MRLIGKILILGLYLALPLAVAWTQAPPSVEVQVVKYDGLKDLVLKNRGKVVVVDFWHTL